MINFEPDFPYEYEEAKTQLFIEEKRSRKNISKLIEAYYQTHTDIQNLKFLIDEKEIIDKSLLKEILMETDWHDIMSELINEKSEKISKMVMDFVSEYNSSLTTILKINKELINNVRKLNKDVIDMSAIIFWDQMPDILKRDNDDWYCYRRGKWELYKLNEDINEILNNYTKDDKGYWKKNLTMPDIKEEVDNDLDKELNNLENTLNRKNNVITPDLTPIDVITDEELPF